VATCDHRRESARRVAERFSAEAYDDYAEMLARPDIDVVSICLPQHLHHSATVRALNAGKHVLCEKPMAMSLQECDAMIDAAKQAVRQLGVVFNFRHSTTARTVLGLVHRGAIGRVCSLVASINLRETASFPPRVTWRTSRKTTTGGVLTHRVIHLLDFLLLILGEPSAIAATLVDDEDGLERTAALAFTFPHDAVATLLATTSAQQVGTRIELFGTGGTLVMTDRTVDLNGQSVPLEADILVPEEIRGCLAFGTGHVWAMREFVAAIQVSAPPPVSGLEGRRMQHLLERIYARAAN
jgi:predicted dehydrogenase